MLDAHHALARTVEARDPVGGVGGGPEEVGEGDVDFGGGGGLEAHFAVPGHVL